MNTKSSQAKNTSLFSFAQNIGLTNAIIFIGVVVSYLFSAPPVSVSSFSERLRLIVADIDAVIPAAFFVTFAIDVGGIVTHAILESDETRVK